jgi:hypothetical protein
LRAFEDGAFLVFDLLAGEFVEVLFFVQQRFQYFAEFLANVVVGLEELDFFHFGERCGGERGQLVDLVVTQSHSTALYLRTSSFFTFLNISW